MIILPSQTNSLNSLVQQKRERGERIYNFAAGDITLPNPSHIKDQVKLRMESGYLPYPPIAGITELRKAVATWMNKSYQTHFSKDNIIITPGGKFAIYAALQILLQQDDEVLIPAPYWVSYPSIVSYCGGSPVIVPAKWKITPQELEKHLTPKSKVLIFNNACNPTGVLYGEDEVKAIVHFAKKFNLTLISDEVYSEINYTNRPYTSAGSHDHVVIIQSFSKNFAMSGWRIGWASAREELIIKINSLLTQTTTGTSLMSQWAALGAIEHAEEVSQYVCMSMKKRRDLFFQLLGNMHELPDSSIYAFLPIKEDNSAIFCEKILAELGIAMVPGHVFGMEGFVRLAFSTSESEIIEGLQLLKERDYL